MANWCNNTIKIEGHACWMAAHEYVTLTFPTDFQVVSKDLFMVEFTCRTKWDPKLEILSGLCRKHNVTFNVKFDEFLCQLKGNVLVDTEGEVWDMDSRKKYE